MVQDATKHWENMLEVRQRHKYIKILDLKHFLVPKYYLTWTRTVSICTQI